MQVDYGTEFQSKVLDAWAFEHGVKLDFIRPGKPVDSLSCAAKRRISRFV